VAGADFGGDGGKADRKFVDQGFANGFIKPVCQAIAADQTGAGKAHIEIAENAALGELARPVLQCIELAGGVAPADHGADRGSDNDIGHDIAGEQCAKYADVGKAARRAAAER
jgi:hypothetical protein